MRVAVISCFDTFRDRQRALVDYFQSRGDSVTAFLSDFQHVTKTYWPAAPDGLTLLHVPAYQKNLSLQRMYSHYRFSSAVRKELEQGQWDLIWAIIPPNSLVKQCAEYRRGHPNTRLIFDVNDLWPESFPMGRLKDLPPFRLWQSLRDNYLPVADHIVTECSLFQKRLALSGAPNATTIYFCKPAEVWPTDRTPQLPADMVSLCYLGSMNHIIDIDAIAAILKSLTALGPVRLHIIGAGENKSSLIAGAKNVGAEVVDHGSVYDPVEKQRIFNQCHFGLNAMKSTVCVGLTMKSIDYFAGGLPLINTIPGDTWDLIERYHFGLNWDGKAVPDWDSFDQRQARTAARRFFDQELTYQSFSRKVESVLARI